GRVDRPTVSRTGSRARDAVFDRGQREEDARPEAVGFALTGMRIELVLQRVAAVLAAALAAIALGPSPAVAPAAPARPRDADGAPARGTATIRGHVAAADTGLPLRKAQVRLTSIENAPGPPRENRLATTDADGRYEFTSLLAGRYSLTASKGSYVGLSYGQ